MRSKAGIRAELIKAHWRRAIIIARLILSKNGLLGVISILTWNEAHCLRSTWFKYSDDDGRDETGQLFRADRSVCHAACIQQGLCLGEGEDLVGEELRVAYILGELGGHDGAESSLWRCQSEVRGQT